MVPEGDCAIRCGDAPPRRWAEGEVLLFDDSFEHEVWNETEQPRVVLIVDIWHPQLRSDAERRRAIEHGHAEQPAEAEAKLRRYLAAAHRRCIERLRIR